MRIATFDPGKATGMVLASASDRAHRPIVLEWAELGFQAVLDRAWSFCAEAPTRTVVVCEQFGFRPGRVTTPQYDHLEIQGALRWIAGRHGCPFILQRVSDAKKLAPDVRALVRGGDGHGRDAARHLVLFWHNVDEHFPPGSGWLT